MHFVGEGVGAEVGVEVGVEDGDEVGVEDGDEVGDGVGLAVGGACNSKTAVFPSDVFILNGPPAQEEGIVLTAFATSSLFNHPKSFSTVFNSILAAGILFTGRLLKE